MNSFGKIAKLAGAAALLAAASLATAQITPDEQNTIAVFKKAAPAVVHVRAMGPPSTTDTDADTDATTTRGTGSGFVIDAAGHVLTNYHVIEGSSRLQLLLSDGQTLDAQLVGTAPAFDIALLKPVLSSALPDKIVPLPLGDSDKVEVGRKVIAIGNPLGLDNTLTVGVVSGLARNLPGAPEGLGHAFLQTDAALNPGNSGGPLLDSAGEVVGVNSVIARGGQNISFAIPINLVKKALPDLKTMGHVYRPLLGFATVSISHGMATLFGLPVRRGLLVQEVTPGTPASIAGLRAGSRMVPMNNTVYVLGGDIIVSVDGRGTATPIDLTKVFLGAKPGDRLRLTVVRDNQRKDLTIILPPMHF